MHKALINVRYRLCIGSAHPETKGIWNLKLSIKDFSLNWQMCLIVFTVDVPEFKECGYWSSFCNTRGRFVQIDRFI